MKPFLFALTLLGISACDPAAETRKTAVETSEQATPPARAEAALTPIANGETLTPEAVDDQNLQSAASVVRVDNLQRPDSTVKLFGLAGGDPAMNGLYTYIAFYQSPADGWQVFRLGDFLDYRILGEGENRVDLEIEYSVMDPHSDQISVATRRIMVTWTPGADGAAPQAITMTAGQ